MQAETAHAIPFVKLAKGNTLRARSVHEMAHYRKETT